MSTLNKALLILALLIASTVARSDGISFNTVGQIEGISFAGKPAAPLVSCASTGIFNLANVCNDIYFIGALK